MQSPKKCTFCDRYTGMMPGDICTRCLTPPIDSGFTCKICNKYISSWCSEEGMTCDACFRERTNNRITREKAEKSLAKMKALSEKLKADVELQTKPTVEELLLNFGLAISCSVPKNPKSLFASVAQALWSDPTSGDMIEIATGCWADVVYSSALVYTPEHVSDAYCVCIKVLDVKMADIQEYMPSAERLVKSTIWLLRDEQGFYQPLEFV